MLSKESAIDLAKKMLNTEQSLEDVLSFFRKEGFSKMQSILMIREINATDLDEARNLVHFSETWKDVAQSDGELLESFYDFLESLESSDE